VRDKHIDLEDFIFALKQEPGWSGTTTFLEHETQDLHRLLSDCIERVLVNTPQGIQLWMSTPFNMRFISIEGIIENLFSGKLHNYIRCTNVDYESVRLEQFWGKLLSLYYPFLVS